MAIRRILVPTDFSKASAKALGLALEIAAPAGAEIVLLHVVQPFVAISPDPTGAASAAMTVLAEQEELAEQKLDVLATATRRRHRPTRALVRTGSTHGVVLETAVRMRADLIVMGTQGRSGLSHLLLGSVAEKVVRLAPCPVLTVGPKARVGGRTRAARPKRR